MPFYIAFTLLTGSGTRFANTAAEAVVIYNELRDAQAGAIAIRDHNGTEFTIEQLTLAASAPKMKRDRDPGFSPWPTVGERSCVKQRPLWSSRSRGGEWWPEVRRSEHEAS
jgi:hypothetical protein